MFLICKGLYDFVWVRNWGRGKEIYVVFDGTGGWFEMEIYV